MAEIAHHTNDLLPLGGSDPDQLPLAGDELDLLSGLLSLEQAGVIEAGCGSARLLRQLVRRPG